MNDLARPKKYGLEYFPLDVYAGKDDELELLEAEYGLEGFAIFIKLLQAIYKNGYYISWSDKEKLLFSKRVNVALTLVNDVITTCLKWDLLNNRIYEQHKILTSHGIQQRFLLAMGRRSAIEIYKDYLLLSESEVSATKNLVIVTKTNVDDDDNPQSKEKESKGKESIVKESSSSEEETITDNIKRIATMLENTFGRIPSRYELEMLSSYIDDGMEVELVEKALAETIENGVRNIKYTRSILERCLKEKILTLKHYAIDQEQKKEQKKVNVSGEHGRDNEEIVRSEAELLLLGRTREPGRIGDEDEELPF